MTALASSSYCLFGFLFFFICPFQFWCFVDFISNLFSFSFFTYFVIDAEPELQARQRSEVKILLHEYALEHRATKETKQK